MQPIGISPFRQTTTLLEQDGKARSADVASEIGLHSERDTARLAPRRRSANTATRHAKTKSAGNWRTMAGIALTALLGGNASLAAAGRATSQASGLANRKLLFIPAHGPGFGPAPGPAQHASPSPSYASKSLSPDVRALIQDLETYGLSEIDADAAAHRPISGNGQEHAVQVGVYADADSDSPAHSLYEHDRENLATAIAATAATPLLHINTRRYNLGTNGSPRVYADQRYDGGVAGEAEPVPGPIQLSQSFLQESLASFVTQTLDLAHDHNATAWLEISAHSNPLSLVVESWQTLSGTDYAFILTPQDVAQAITTGIQRHAIHRPGDARRRIEGVVFSGCGGDTAEFAANLADADVKTFVGTATYATDFPISVYPLLTKNTTRQEFADAVVRTPAAGDDNRANAESNVEDLTDSKADIAYSLGIAVAKQIKVAIRANPQQNATIQKAVENIHGAWASYDKQSIEDLGGSKILRDKPAVKIYSAIANDAAVAPAVRETAGFAATAFKNVLAAHAISQENPNQVIDLADQIGPAIPFPVDNDQNEALGLSSYSEALYDYGFTFPSADALIAKTPPASTATPRPIQTPNASKTPSPKQRPNPSTSIHGG